MYPHAFRIPPYALGDPLNFAQCERLASYDRRIGAECEPCDPKGSVAMLASEQRHKHAFGEHDPVAVAVVYSRDNEQFGERVQDRAKDREWRVTPSEQTHERMVEGGMGDAFDRDTERFYR